MLLNQHNNSQQHKTLSKASAISAKNKNGSLCPETHILTHFSLIKRGES